MIHGSIVPCGRAIPNPASDRSIELCSTHRKAIIPRQSQLSVGGHQNLPPGIHLPLPADSHLNVEGDHPPRQTIAAYL